MAFINRKFVFSLKLFERRLRAVRDTFLQLLFLKADALFWRMLFLTFIQIMEMISKLFMNFLPIGRLWIAVSDESIVAVRHNLKFVAENSKYKFGRYLMN